jgi:hypothetical protein
MTIKKILVLLIFAIAIVGIIAPVNAALNVDWFFTYEKKPINGKNGVDLMFSSNIGKNTKDPHAKKYVDQRKRELNKVNKVVVTVRGHKTTTFKKPSKGWNDDYGVMKSFSLKGSAVYKKDYSVKLYDKNNKVLKSKRGKVPLGGG